MLKFDTLTRLDAIDPLPKLGSKVEQEPKLTPDQVRREAVSDFETGNWVGGGMRWVPGGDTFTMEPGSKLYQQEPKPSYKLGEDVKDAAIAAIKRAGVDRVRDAIKGLGAARLVALPASQYPAAIAALNALK